jgi:hypothetical protein
LLRKLLLVLSAAAMLTFGAAPAFAQPDQTADAQANNGDTTQIGLINVNGQSAGAAAGNEAGEGNNRVSAAAHSAARVTPP